MWKQISLNQNFYGNENSFGHPGAGGAFCFDYPDEKLGYTYAMNKHGQWTKRTDAKKNPVQLPMKKWKYVKIVRNIFMLYGFWLWIVE